MPNNSKNQESGFNVIQIVILIMIVLVLGVVVIAAFSSAKEKARDAKRVSDVSQLQLALKNYYEEYGGYPQTGSGNIAVGSNDSFKKFVPSWPEAPQPQDGLCTPEYNNYAYQQLDGGSSYQIRFCLGDNYGNLKAGVRIVTPQGVQ